MPTSSAARQMLSKMGNFAKGAVKTVVRAPGKFLDKVEYRMKMKEAADMAALRKHREATGERFGRDFTDPRYVKKDRRGK